MTGMTIFKLGYELAGVKVPDLDRFVVTRADESATVWVERESANKLVVTGESLNTFST